MSSLLATGQTLIDTEAYAGMTRHPAQFEPESVYIIIIIIAMVTWQFPWACSAACHWPRILWPEPTGFLALKAYCVMQNGQAGYSYTDRSARRLDGPVDLYTGPQAKRANLEICRRPNGTLWLLGEGACGKVYKVRHTRITDRQTRGTDRQ